MEPWRSKLKAVAFMFVLFNESQQLNPIKVWLKSASELNQVCKKQAVNLSNIPHVHKWIALMPDTHQGYGMPIGGVAAVKDIVIPNAVGVDIGCGVIYIDTGLHRSKLKERHGKKIIQKLMERIPVGFRHHQEKQANKAIQERLEMEAEYLKLNQTLYQEIEPIHYQIGTLGGGNHFIELQEDEQGMIGIMIHSGSRNFGYKVANYYNDKAKYYAKKHNAQRHSKNQLAYLPAESEAGRAYIRWMNLALLFARENRYHMMRVVKEVLDEMFAGITYGEEVNAHHNYASLEHHYGEDVWVHRKGAIRVYKDEIGIIPGAMGSFSYIVKGLGNPESFCSCSHGAGRHLSRRQAMKKYKKEMVLKDLYAQGVLIGTPSKSIIVDESRFVYKDINQVMEQQKDLIVPVKKLKTIIVVKG